MLYHDYVCGSMLDLCLWNYVWLTGDPISHSISKTTNVITTFCIFQYTTAIVPYYTKTCTKDTFHLRYQIPTPTNKTQLPISRALNIFSICLAFFASASVLRSVLSRPGIIIFDLAHIGRSYQTKNPHPLSSVG